MPAKIGKVKVLSVRLPELEIRRLKTTAAARGMSIQEAVQRAVENWVTNAQGPLNIESLLALEGSWTGGDDVDTMRRKEREFELAKEARWS